METSRANTDAVLPVQTKGKEMKAAGGARSVKCGCITQVCQILTAACSGTNTSEKNNGIDCITIPAIFVIYVHVYVAVTVSYSNNVPTSYVGNNLSGRSGCYIPLYNMQASRITILDMHAYKLIPLPYSRSNKEVLQGPSFPLRCYSWPDRGIK